MPKYWATSAGDLGCLGILWNCFGDHFSTHWIHVWYIYLRIYHKNQPHVGKYTVHGSFGVEFSRVDFPHVMPRWAPDGRHFLTAVLAPRMRVGKAQRGGGCSWGWRFFLGCSRWNLGSMGYFTYTLGWNTTIKKMDFTQVQWLKPWWFSNGGYINPPIV